MATDGDHGTERDPLLVRPYLLRDSAEAAESGADEPSPQTWPAAGARETPPSPGPAGAGGKTEVLDLPTGDSNAGTGHGHGGGKRRRRLLIGLAAAAVVILGASAAGYAVLRPGLRPAVTAAQPGAPLPAVTGPQPSASPPSTSAPPQSQQRPGGNGPAATTAAPTTTAPSTPTATTPSTATATSAAGGAPPSSPASSVSSAPTQGGTGSTAGSPLGIAPARPRIGTVRGQNGLCLDLNGAVAVDGNHVQVFDCNTSVAQTWTLAADGTLRVLGMCALLTGDTTVHVVKCDGRTPAQWQVSGQRLVSAANGGCLTDPSGGRASGTGVTVTPCTNGANQHWSFP